MFMSLSTTDKQDLFRYINTSFDLNPDAKIYSLICEFCRDNGINILLSDIDKIGLEYLTEYQNKRNRNDESKGIYEI